MYDFKRKLPVTARTSKILNWTEKKDNQIDVNTEMTEMLEISKILSSHEKMLQVTN